MFKSRFLSILKISAFTVLLLINSSVVYADVDVTKYPLGISPKTLHDLLVDDNFVRVSLNIVGIMFIMFILNYFVIDLIANTIALQVDEDEGLVYTIVNAILVCFGRLFEGLRIIFLMTLFMDLEGKN